MFAASPRQRSTRAVATALLAVVAAAVAAVAGCDSGGQIRKSPSPCAPQRDERPGNALVRCSEHSVVYVETDDASGTGVVFDRDGVHYVLTNSHVVDPFGAVALTLDGERWADVDVVGIDAGADIAVVGPLPDEMHATPVVVAPQPLPRRGDDVYLVGYPGEAPPDDPGDLETTIASGIVSRIRQVKSFDQTYVQTDASIAGGQSGGPLFDAQGDLLGISGLGFAEEFALALSAEDVSIAVDRILGGDGDDYAAVPVVETDDMVTSGEIDFTDAVDEQILFIPAADTDRTLEFGVDGVADLVVTITSSADEWPLAVSSNVDDVYARLEQMITAAGGEEDPFFDDEYQDEEPSPEEVAAREAETAPGRFQLDVPADAALQVSLTAPLISGPVTATFTSTIAVHPLTRGRPVTELAVGDTADQVLGSYDSGADFLIELEEGQEVEVRVESAQSDVGYTVFAPSVMLDPVVLNDPYDREGVEDVDDSGDGLYGLDAVGVVGGGAAGVYRVRVYNNEYLTVLARITVTDCDDTDCPEE